MEIDGSLIGLTGRILAGSIGTMTVGRTLGGQVRAPGTGTIGRVTINGDIGPTGTIMAVEDPNPGAGTVGMVSVGGTISGGDLIGVDAGGLTAG